MRAADRVVINTSILYVRMLITVGISLYSTRLVLEVLGSIDYGINNLIAGVVAMLSFLNVAMATSTQRYLSFYRGKGDPKMQLTVFNNSLTLHIIIGIFMVIALELIGISLFDFLNIPVNRIDAAKVIYHYMSVTVFFSIAGVPFTASLIGNENMLWLASGNVFETVMKLAIALALPMLAGDKLVLYGACIAAITAFIFVANLVFCYKNYQECSFKGVKKIDTKLIKELTSYAGWNLFGSLCGLARSQGLAVLLNLFFGATINAAFAIANQVGNQLKFFSVSMLRVVNPQIMMSEGANDRKKMLRLAMTASKFSFFLLAFIAIPCMFEMQPILKFWLKNVPENATMFSILILLGALVNQLTIGLQSAAQATGKIKAYQAVVGTTLILNLPVAYVLLKFGYDPRSAIISYVVIEAIACTLRIFFLKKLANLSIKEFVNRVFVREIFPVIMICLTSFLITLYVEHAYRFLISITISAIVFFVTVYFTGLCRDEKEIIDRMVQKIVTKILSQNSARKSVNSPA